MYPAVFPISYYARTSPLLCVLTGYSFITHHCSLLKASHLKQRHEGVITYSFDYLKGSFKIRNCKEVCLKPSVLAHCQSRNPLWNSTGLFLTSVTDKYFNMIGPENVKSPPLLVTYSKQLSKCTSWTQNVAGPYPKASTYYTLLNTSL